MYVPGKARGFPLRMCVCRRQELTRYDRDWISRARAKENTQFLGREGVLEFAADNSGRIEEGSVSPSSPLSLSHLLFRSSTSFRAQSGVPREVPSSLTDTRIHLVSFLSAKWPGSRLGVF